MARKGKRKQLVNPDDLAPKIASGLTQDVSVEEALQDHPVDPRPSGIEIARNFSAAEQRAAVDVRDDSVHFIGRPDPTVKVTEPNTGREMIDAIRVIPHGHKQQILAGYRCLECLEHFGGGVFPLHCPLCGFEVHERQILKANMEFEGEVHVGPSKPLREVLQAQDERVEKRKFMRRVLGGHSAKIPTSWLRDAALLEGLETDELEALGGMQS